jgi:hypothetical protein
MEEQIINSSMEIILPVIESSMVLAAEYAKACGRTAIMSKDMQYAMRYCAMNITGKHIGTLFPEIHEDDSDSDEDDLEIVDESEDDFTRYSGDNELFNKVNEAYDNWDNWKPYSPIEKMLKNAVDKNSEN